jgi:hypothetical protein
MDTTSTPVLRIIITGATGMVGEGVLHECLNAPEVQQIVLLNRKASGIVHPKVKEIIHADLFDLSAIEDQLIGYNACFFCLGISSVGISKEEYYKTTYELTMKVATTLSRLNADMTFCYISGAGTNGSEKGGSNWSRVKGKTENDLKLLQFKQVYNFRPGMLETTPGLAYPCFKGGLSEGCWLFAGVGTRNDSCYGIWIPQTNARSNRYQSCSKPETLKVHTNEQGCCT